MKTQPTFREAFEFWLKLGFISFGGPAGQIAIMHVYLVEKKKWISESKFLHALSFCMILPGPEAQQLATYIGWLMHGKKGGLTAGILFAQFLGTNRCKGSYAFSYLIKSGNLFGKASGNGNAFFVFQRIAQG